ncbi:hypothetical protein MKW94_003201, partial [Papaver nudicaule]|nr:hypothetical protein [Papaver nudicaule]
MRLIVGGGRATEDSDSRGAVIVGVRTLSEGGRVGNFSREQCHQSVAFVGMDRLVRMVHKMQHCKIYAELLRSAELAVEKGQAQGRNETYVKLLSDYIVPALVEALHK